VGTSFGVLKSKTESNLERERRFGSRGQSLAEVLIALFLMAIAVLAAAPALVLSMEQNDGSADLGQAGATAIARMEQLRATPFYDLLSGGSLVSDQTGFFDDSDPQVTVRWQITSGGGPADIRTIRVRALTARRSGPPRSVRLMMLRAR